MRLIRSARRPPGGLRRDPVLFFNLTRFFHRKDRFPCSQNIRRQVVNFLQAEDGPTAVEYAVMLALIIVV